MNYEMYLLGGNIRNHRWKLVCQISGDGDINGDEYFKFIDESNDRYYGLWKRENKTQERICTGGGNLSIVERDVRLDKFLMGWHEPNTRHCWNSETARDAALKRWGEIDCGTIHRYKRITLANGDGWRLMLRVREDGMIIYSSFEF